MEDLTGRGSVALNDATQARDRQKHASSRSSIRQQLFTSFSTSTPQFNYDLDRNKAKLLGLNLPDVFNTPADLSSGRSTSTTSTCSAAPSA